MADNSWGYAWTPVTSDEDSNTNSTYTYNTLNPNGSNIKDNFTDTKVTNFSVNFSRQLTFAAKFAEDATSGHYKANVTLSLAATPREVATGFNGIYDMQDMTTDICDSATIGQTGSLEDIRDGSIYTVGKLSDGNCWMTRNLLLTREGIEANGGTGTLTAGDSNVVEDFEMPASITKETITPTDFSNVDYYAAQIYAASIEDASSVGAEWQPSYGAYYSFTAATAGSGDKNLTSGDASADVCPKGWKLPSQKIYLNFLAASGINDLATGTDKFERIKTYFSPTGLAYDGKIHFVGARGRYWSSMVLSDSRTYALAFEDNNLTSGPYLRYSGYPVRCVAKDNRTLSDITRMQDMTPQVCENTAIGATKTLTDSRDNSTYTVEKLKDGKCWMTQNLRLMNKTITSADSDTAKTFTIPSSALWTDTSYTTPHAYYNNNTTYGAYYNWYTATAGTGTNSVSSGNATSSICPRGWRLPKSASGTGTNEFAVAVGLTNTNISAGSNYWTGLSNPSLANNALTVNDTTWAAAGYVNTNRGLLGGIDVNGYYWSSAVNNTTNAYGLFFGNSDFRPFYSNYKYDGFSVRCLAR